MLSGFDSEPSEDKTSPQTDFNQEFVENYIQTQKAKIQTRKLIQEFLFFATCQVASASLAILLFQFAVQVLFTSWLCLFVAWLPSLTSLTEINFQRTQDGWNLQIMNRPIITLVKFVSGVGITTFTVYSIAGELHRTTEQIYATYEEIQRYESPRVENYLPPYFFQVLLASIGIVLLASYLKNSRNPWN